MSKNDNQQFPPVYKNIREKIINYLENSKLDETFNLIKQILSHPNKIDDNLIFIDSLRLFG